jgi:CRISPR-associated endonuclease Csn1
MKKVLGLDIGIASVGWAITEILDDEKLGQYNPETGEVVQGSILGMGVRTFTQAENPKDGKSLALPRREKRSSRRRLRRRRYRLDKIANLFVESDILSRQEIESILKPQAHEKSPWELRAEALDRLLTKEELFRTLYHITKLRGYKPAKGETIDENKKAEEGRVKEAIKENTRKLDENSLLTFPQLLVKNNKNGEAFRNKSDSYINSIPRNLVEKEANLILQKQYSLGNNFINKEFIAKYSELAFSQKSAMDRTQMEKMIGKCTFESTEMKAPRNSYSAELFVLLTKIANLNLRTVDNPERIELTNEQRNKIKAAAFDKITALTYKNIRKTLDLDDNIIFKGLNYTPIKNKTAKEKDPETEKFIELKGYHEIKKAYEEFGKEEFNSLLNNPSKFDEICEILTTTKTEEEALIELNKIVDSKIAEKLKNITFTKYIHISLKALYKINPFLEQGKNYSEACKLAGYNHYNPDEEKEKFDLLPSFEELKKKGINFDQIRNPVVHRAVCQVRKVVNAIIRQYGKPDQINIEFTREAKNSFKERKKIERGQKDFREDKEQARKQCLNLGLNPDEGANLLRLRLWAQQDEKCVYSGKNISISNLKDYSSLDIDHIIPYSRCLDDSLNNKVLCFANENRQKGNKIPAEYLGVETEEWIEFKNKILSSKLPMPKKNRLLKEKFENSDDFIERNLRDTSYAVRYTADYIKAFLRLNENTKIKNKVQTRNGSLTAFLRHNWGFDKVRSAGDKHHALDALVCAVSTQGMVQYLSNFTKLKEEKGKEWLKNLAINSNIPTPWGDKEGFRNEAKFHLDKIFVSRAPRRKASGEIHQETIRTIKKLKSEGVSGIRTKLSSLKVKNADELADKIFDTDRSQNSIYQILKERLEEHNWNAEKAFVTPLYMRKKDGTEGPLVKSVRVKDNQKSGIIIRDGIANNGDMARVDVFSKTENGRKKFYLVPIYLKDFASGVLPNKAATAMKGEEDWRVIDDGYTFEFTLCKDDLILVKKRSDSEILGYYNAFNRATAAITFENNDRSKIYKEVGAQSLEVFKKYSVDILGNYSEVKNEKRMPIGNKK